MIEFLMFGGLIIGSILFLINLGFFISIDTYGLHHMYEVFTYKGTCKSHPNLNVAGCILFMIISYILLLPCAIFFWIAKLFIRSDYF